MYHKGMQYLALHNCSTCSLHKNRLLIPQSNQLLRHSWKTPSTLLLWKLHTLVNVLLGIPIQALKQFDSIIVIYYAHCKNIS